jgi:hypothetical protein
MRTIAPLIICLLASLAHAQIIVESPIDGVVVVRSDNGNWGGMTTGISHMNWPTYVARKRLDLSAVPDDVWDNAKEVRISAWLLRLDYSFMTRDDGKYDGFAESFRVTVNDHEHVYPTSTALVETTNVSDAAHAWYDFVIPIEHLTRGENVISIAKKESELSNDYIYVGIDNTIDRGHSDVSYDGGTHWRDDQLTKTAGDGEYMVRVVFVLKPLDIQATWTPSGALDDPHGLIGFAGRGEADGWLIELDTLPLNPQADITAEVQAGGETTLQWITADRKPVAGDAQPYGLRITGGDVPSVTVHATRSYHPVIRPPNMAPAIAAPAGAPAQREPQCVIADSRVELTGPALRATFTTTDGLRLVSLHNEWAGREMIADAAKMRIFMVELNGERYGAADFKVIRSFPLHGGPGVGMQLIGPHDLGATFTAMIDDAGQLRMTLNLRHEGPEDATSLDFKVAFPHMAGLKLSDDLADDYYLFPWGGGVIADTPAKLRRGYGDYEALWQMVDLFSPQLGAGLMIRVDDDEGFHKIIALHKQQVGQPVFDGDKAQTPTGQQYVWSPPALENIDGLGVAVEYLRRTRLPGEHFAPEPVVIAAHNGGWKVAMQRYRQWAHEVWDWRPYPNRHTSYVNTMPIGWGQEPLVEVGVYRMDTDNPVRDCAEIMSWWEWALLGPWRTPWGELKQKLGEKTYNRYSSYWVRDPVTDELMYPINRGDYDGYNQRWGGLPKLREAIQGYQDAGMPVILYTDPILADDNTKLAHHHGEQWCVVNYKGENRTNYESWNMCHDNPRYREFVRDTMRRVMVETGADGIRLDEYGHGGAACFSDKHDHTWVEPGTTQWLKGIAETTRMVREGMDEVAPGSILTAEFPGYDYMMQFMEGSITYEFLKQGMWLRPVELDVTRFYLREHATMEYSFSGSDPDNQKKLFNGKLSFGTAGEYIEPMFSLFKQNQDVFISHDVEPLVETLKPYVYANRFAGADKTVWTLYNGGSFTVEGDLLAVPLDAEQHLVDPLDGRDLGDVRRDGAAIITGRMTPGRTRVVMRLPRRLQVQRSGDSVRVRISGTIPPDATLATTDLNQQPIDQQPARGGETRLALPPTGPAWVKMMSDGQVLDMWPIE